MRGQALERTGDRLLVARKRTARLVRGGCGAGAQARCERANRLAGSDCLLSVLEWAEAMHVDTRGPEAGALGQKRIGECLPERAGGMPRTDEHRLCPREPLAGEPQEALGVGLDGVLQRAAVDLDRVRHLGECPREDRGTHDQVVGERYLRAHPGCDLFYRGHVGDQVAVDLRGAALERRSAP